MLAGEVFQEDRGIQNQVSTCTKRTQTSEQAEHDPVWSSTGDNGENRGDEERNVEGEATADDVGREAPKQRADQHSHIDGNRQTGIEAGLELEGGLGGDDGLQQQDERVDGVSEAIEAEQLGLVRSEPDLIDGLARSVL